MKHRYLKNVVTLRLSADKCIGCERCVEVCPHRVFSMSDKKAKIEDKDFCMECGACAKNCPTNAITVNVGVGCAQAVIMGWLKGNEPSCDCSSGEGCC
ncbi:MAG TPA: 4Fe-4S binding protein [Clostridiaceae bacterium]|nr:4Fe-4S binding protein [Clostridiaceae bacterium]